MERMSKRNPDSSIAGRKGARSAIWLARNWLREAGDRRAFGGAPRDRLGDGALGVALDDPRGVGVGSLDDDLHRGVAGGGVAAEMARDADDAVDVMSEHRLLGLTHRVEVLDLEV